MKSILLILFASAISLSAFDCEFNREMSSIRIPDIRGNMHTAGRLCDVLINYSKDEAVIAKLKLTISESIWATLDWKPEEAKAMLDKAVDAKLELSDTLKTQVNEAYKIAVEAKPIEEVAPAEELTP